MLYVRTKVETESCALRAGADGARASEDRTSLTLWRTAVTEDKCFKFFFENDVFRL